LTGPEGGAGSGAARPNAAGNISAGTAAVVVNYNAGDYLPGCLRSLRAAGAAPRLVVDNGSVDDSREQAKAADPDHHWIDTGRNLGYGQGANVGVAATTTPYVLVCNADLEVDPGIITVLSARLDAEAELGLVAPQVLNVDGTIYPSARTFPNLVDAIGPGLLGRGAPNNRFTRRYRLLDWDHGDSARVDWVSGACFLARRRAWDSVGGFDQAYFMYLEDVDLCRRIGEAGWGVSYEPGASVTHVQGVSASQRPYRMLVAHHRSLWRYARHTTTGARRLALPVVGVGLVARLGVACAQHRLARNRPARAGQPGRVP
jgi:N-acetylglucosaminyl-diphospho-decaprenol L-rhamnosyltransferase